MSTRAPFPPFPWKTLRRSLRADERSRVASAVRAMLRFQRSLEAWKCPKNTPDATPFVSLYVDGKLRGCYGSDEGAPGERLARAFLRALDDGRFGGVRANERDRVTAHVSYVRRARLVNPETAADEIELGVHGAAVVPSNSPATLLLPHVVRDEHVGATEFLRRLAAKARLGDDDLRDHALYLFETEDVVVREGASQHRDERGVSAARRWLASLVAADGKVTFAVDPRTGKRTPTGEMHHGRAAVVLQALEGAAAYTRLVSRGKNRLFADARAALEGATIEGWPTEPARVAGTLALATRASVDLRRELLAFVAAHDVRSAPWHAAQIVAALGRDAPDSLWSACVADLDARPWAPWTLLAADARGELEVRARVAKLLCDGLREEAPHRGAGTLTPVPEIALTALAVEALARHPASFARAAAKRARDFIARAQLVDDRIYGALDADVAWGAFPASLCVDSLRGDVTGHAVLALSPT